MSDAATPPRAPASGDGSTNTDSIVNDAMALLAEDGDDEPAATTKDSGAAEAPPPVRQATASADEDADPPSPDVSETTEPEKQTEEPTPTYRVKVRGQDREVTLPELLNGYSRTEDYKAKTAEVADARKAVERTHAEAQARIARLDQLIELAPVDPILAEGARTDWARLAQDDPLTYTQRRGAFDERLQRLQSVMTERQKLAKEESDKALDAAEEHLRETVPEWADKAKRTDLQRRIQKMATSTYGFQPQDLDRVTDPRLVRVLRDALAYREQQSQRATVSAQRVAPAPARVIRPGGGVPVNTASERARALAAKANRTGHLDDQVDAIMAALGD